MKTNKKLLLSTFSLCLILLIVVSSLHIHFVCAINNIFTGIDDTEVEENTNFDLLQGVSAHNHNGEELKVSISNVVCENDTSFFYDNSNILNVNTAGSLYTVEYIAVSYDGLEKHSATRKIISIQSQDSENNTTSDEETSENTTTNDKQDSDNTITNDKQDSDNTITNDKQDSDNTITNNKQDSENNTINNENILQNDSPATNGLPIIYENGFHYIEDPNYPEERIILYCMNNKLKWPHVTPNQSNVPNYTNGYLKPDDFASEADYNECIRKLKKILFAGYPYNGERLYKIIPNEHIHVPTIQDFNAMLIVPPQLQQAFPVLAHHSFTLDALNNKIHFDVLTDFLHQVALLVNGGTTSNGLVYSDITSMPFYKAVFCLTYNGFGQPEELALNTFANMYSASYFVTEVQAYDATQLAIWKLLCDYKVPNNNIQDISHNALAQILLQFSKHGSLLEYEPKIEDLYLEGDLRFDYNPKDGMWHSGNLKITEPPAYRGLYEFHLPKGVTAICENLSYVYGNEEYKLISDKQPMNGNTFKISAKIDWLKDMKQYTPINDTRFQSMIGAVIRKKPISADIPYNSTPIGSLEVSKTVLGENTDKEFNFNLQILNHKISGLYGEFEFNNGSADFTLKNGESITGTHLPADAEYVVTEIDTGEYHISSNNSKGIIVADQITKVEFINEKLPELTLSKVVTGESGDQTKKFTFEITLKDSNGNPVNNEYNYVGEIKNGYENEILKPNDGKIKFQNGIATISLSHGQQIAIKNLPLNSTYTIVEKEENQDNYTTSYNGKSEQATGILNQNTEVHVVNNKEFIPITGIIDNNNHTIELSIAIAITGILLTAIIYLLRLRKGIKQ